MTLPRIPTRLDTRPCGADGWYAYRTGEEVRCPGQDQHRKAGFSGRCNKYMGTVQEGVMYVRPEIRLHQGIERRAHPRFRDKCSRCGTPLEVEMRGNEAAA
jgi:hypothetical protein